MTPARFPYARTTLPMNPPAPTWTTRPTDPAPVMERVTEPLALAPSGPVLPFQPAFPMHRAKTRSEAPSRLALAPAPTFRATPPPLSTVRCRTPTLPIGIGAAGLLLLLLVVMASLSLRSATATEKAIESTVMVAPVPLCRPTLDIAITASVPSIVPSAASVVPVRPRGPARPTSPPPRPSTRSEIVDPWGG